MNTIDRLRAEMARRRLAAQAAARDALAAEGVYMAAIAEELKGRCFRVTERWIGSENQAKFMKITGVDLNRALKCVSLCMVDGDIHIHTEDLYFHFKAHEYPEWSKDPKDPLIEDISAEEYEAEWRRIVHLVEKAAGV